MSQRLRGVLPAAGQRSLGGAEVHAHPNSAAMGSAFLADTGYSLGELARADTVIIPAIADPLTPAR